EVVEGFPVGRRVGAEPNYSCGRCPLCREGNRNLCLSRTAVGIDVDGGFAEEAGVPGRCCHRAPAGIGDDALMLSEPLAVVVRAVNRGEPRPGESAAVLGVGSLGLLAVQVLKARGLRVLAISRSDRRLDIAREVGADAVAVSGAGADVAASRAFSRREGGDLVVETAGTAPALGHGVALCRPGGRVVLTGLPHERTEIDFFQVVRREIRISGSMIYQGEFPEAIALLERGTVRVDRLLTHRFGLDRIGDAFLAHSSRDCIKVALAI